jgi:hypothetical protein
MPESPLTKRLTKFWSVFLTTGGVSIRKGFAALAFWEWKSGCGAWEEFLTLTQSPGAAQRLRLSFRYPNLNQQRP